MSVVLIHQERKQAQYFIEALGKDVELEMILIPSGSLMMGSPEDELERIDTEGPQHPVTVNNFFMGRYLVTQAQWRVVASLPQINQALKTDPSSFKGDRRPVENVSWHDAVEFCDRLSQKTSRSYRLPTEAEWEYACRAGTITPFHFGETITTDIANYRGTDNDSMGWKGNYGSGPKGEYRAATTEVNYFDSPNAFGLCDMHGNVWEWCQDHWHENYKKAPTNGSAWLTNDENSERVVRGGSWNNYPPDCRCAIRYRINPDDSSFNIGFRVVCDAPRTLP